MFQYIIAAPVCGRCCISRGWMGFVGKGFLFSAITLPFRLPYSSKRWHTWWLIPLSKWLVTPIISGLTLLIPFITVVINPLTKWDEPPSRHLKTHYQPQHLLSVSVFYLLLFTSFICLTYSACCKKLTCGVTWPFVFQMAVCGNLNELYNWLVVWNMFYFPFHIWDVILPIDELIFFKMV